MSRATAWQSGITIPIAEETHIALEELAEQMHEPMQTVLAKAVDTYWRQHVIEAHNVAYAAVRADPQAWQEELDERRAWDVTLADGLADDKPLGNGSKADCEPSATSSVKTFVQSLPSASSDAGAAYRRARW